MLGSEIWVMLVAAVAGIALAAVVVTIIRDRAGEPEDVTIGFLGPTLAAIYLLVLAFALVTEWQTNADARQSVVNEAAALRGLQWSAPGLPASSAATLHRQLDAYLSQVVHHDWPQMRDGRLSDDSERLIAAMYRSALRANPATNAQSAAQQNVVGQLDSLLAARSQRDADAAAGPSRIAGRGPGHVGGHDRLPVRGRPAGINRVAGHGWTAGGPRSGRGSGGVPAQPGLRWPARRRSRGDRGRGPVAPAG